MITLQFSSQDKIGSKLIQWFTWSDYSHVDFVLPDGRLLGARGDGVRLRVQYGQYDELLRVNVDASSEVITKALTQIGKPYDYSALAGFVFRRNWQDNRAWFCSELVAWAFLECGYEILNTQETSRITPRDLLLSPMVRNV